MTTPGNTVNPGPVTIIGRRSAVKRQTDFSGRQRVDESKSAQHLLPFPAEILGGQPSPGAPFGSMKTWKEMWANTTQSPHGTKLETRPYGRGDLNYDQAVNLHPPAVLMYNRHDEFGRTQYLIQSSTTVHLATILARTPGASNVNYEVQSIDRSYRSNAPQFLTPLDRWPGITYPAKQIGGLVLMLVHNDSEMDIFAFEPPQLNQCPTPSAAAPSSSTFALTGGI